MISTNISEKENEHNVSEAKKAGIPTEKFEVLYHSFDDLSRFEDGTFDLIISNDSLLHAADHSNTAKEMGRLLRPGGAAIFSDLLQ